MSALRRPTTPTVCASCKREIVWALTTTGKRMPLDPDAVPLGNVEIVGETNDRVPLCRVVQWQSGAEGERYVTHFSTCPDADVWRRRPSAPRRSR